MAELAVLVPVLNRPHRVQPLLESIAQATPDARVIFICDPDDEGEIAAIHNFTLNEPPVVRTTLMLEGGSYAHKINYACEHSHEPLIFLGADDLDFRPGWLEKAMPHLRRAEVVGVNDRIIRRLRPNHATHFLMTRAYAERPTIDGEPGPLCEAYSHWCCDDELIATATRRCAYVYTPDAWVEHLHPMNRRAADDETYRKGRANARADRGLFRQRSALWT